MIKNNKEPKEALVSNNISRKEALNKMGKYAALTAIGTYIILNPLHSQGVSLPPPNTDNPFSDLKG